ncbi:MAG: DUF2059 domain-containing protein [Terricaulis sp.]
MLALGFMATLGVQPAAADEASRQRLATEVIALMDVSETIMQMFDTLSPMIASQAAGEMHLTASEEARLGELLAEEFRTATPDLMASVAQAYAANISEQNLVEIRDFLQSPAGQAMTASQGQVQSELEEAGQNIGMQVASRALGRFAAERQAGGGAGKH